MACALLRCVASQPGSVERRNSFVRLLLAEPVQPAEPLRPRALAPMAFPSRAPIALGSALNAPAFFSFNRFAVAVPFPSACAYGRRRLD